MDPPLPARSRRQQDLPPHPPGFHHLVRPRRLGDRQHRMGHRPELLGAEQPEEAASPPDSASQEPAGEAGAVAPPKKGKKREARAEPSFKPEDAAAQALQDFFGN